jgi:hypothetical protein
MDSAVVLDLQLVDYGMVSDATTSGQLAKPKSARCLAPSEEHDATIHVVY